MTDWMAEDAARARARVVEVDAELKRLAQGQPARVATAEPLSLEPPAVTVHHHVAAPQVRVEGPVVHVPKQPAPEVHVRVERPVVHVPAPQVAVRVEGPQVHVPEPRVPAVHVEAPQVVVHVDMAGAVAQLVAGLKGALVVQVAPPQVVVHHAQAQPAGPTQRGWKYAVVRHRIMRDAKGDIAESNEVREYSDEKPAAQDVEP